MTAEQRGDGWSVWGQTHEQRVEQLLGTTLGAVVDVGVSMDRLGAAMEKLCETMERIEGRRHEPAEKKGQRK